MTKLALSTLIVLGIFAFFVTWPMTTVLVLFTAFCIDVVYATISE